MTENNENDIIAQRRQHLARLRKEGNAYPNNFRRNALAGELIDKYADKSKEDLEALSVRVAVAGRMMSKRVMGKASFAHIQDMSAKLQLYIRRDDLPEGLYQEFRHWDIGDIVGDADENQQGGTEYPC